MVKVLDQDVLGERLIVDDEGGLGHHVVSPDLGVLELCPGQRLVHVEEVDLAHHGGPGVAAAPWEGRLRVGDPSLLELVPAARDPAIDVQQEQAEAEQELQPHGGCMYLKLQPDL